MTSVPPDHRYVELHVYRDTGPGGSGVLVRKTVHHVRCAVLGNIRPPTSIVGDPMPWPQALRMITDGDHTTCQQCGRRRLYGDGLRRLSLTDAPRAETPPVTEARPLPLPVQPTRYRAYVAMSGDGSTSLHFVCRECGPDLPWGARPGPLERWSWWAPHYDMGVAGHWSTGYRPVVTDRFRHDRWHDDPVRRRHRAALFEETVRALFDTQPPDSRR